MCVCVCVCVYTYEYIYIYMNIYMYIYDMFVCMYVGKRILLGPYSRPMPIALLRWALSKSERPEPDTGCGA